MTERKAVHIRAADIEFGHGLSIQDMKEMQQALEAMEFINQAISQNLRFHLKPMLSKLSDSIATCLDAYISTEHANATGVTYLPEEDVDESICRFLNGEDDCDPPRVVKKGP